MLYIIRYQIFPFAKGFTNIYCKYLQICKICRFANIYIYVYNIQSRSPKKNICWFGTQKLLIWKTETAIFLARKHEKTIMTCSYLIFYKYFLHFKLLTRNILKNKSIHLNSWHHNHKKQKHSLETHIVLLIFSLNLKYLEWSYKEYINSKKW